MSTTIHMFYSHTVTCRGAGEGSSGRWLHCLQYHRNCHITHYLNTKRQLSYGWMLPTGINLTLRCCYMSLKDHKQKLQFSLIYYQARCQHNSWYCEPVQVEAAVTTGFGHLTSVPCCLQLSILPLINGKCFGGSISITKPLVLPVPLTCWRLSRDDALCNTEKQLVQTRTGS